MPAKWLDFPIDELKIEFDKSSIPSVPGSYIFVGKIVFEEKTSKGITIYLYHPSIVKKIVSMSPVMNKNLAIPGKLKTWILGFGEVELDKMHGMWWRINLS